MATDFTTWERATLEQFAREARDKLVALESLETKRMKDAVTVDDWRLIAQHMEYQWRCCSNGLNYISGRDSAAIAELVRFIGNYVEPNCGCALCNDAEKLITKHQQPPITD